MANNRKKILKGSMLRVTLLMSNIIIGFFMMPFLIHNLGDEQYGMWVLVSAVVSFYSLMDFGMASAMQRFLIRSIHSNKLKSSKIALTTSVVVSTAIGLITLLITITIIVVSPYFISKDVNYLLFSLTIGIIGLKASLQLPLFAYYGILVANYRYDVISIIQFFTMILRTTLIIVFVQADYSIISIAVISLLTDISGSLVIIRYAKKLMPNMEVSLAYFRLSKLKEYLHFGKWNYVIQITHKIRFSIDEFVVGTVVGLSAVTHYTIASTLITYFSSFMESAFGVFEPFFHKYHKLGQWDNLRETFTVTTEITTYASILVGSLLFSLGEPFIHIWMGDNYSDTAFVLLILCTANIFYKSILPCEKIIFAIDKQKFYAKTSTIEAIANLSISLSLTPYLGIYGVAIGTLIPSLASNLVLLPMYTCRQLSLPYRNFYTTLVKACILGSISFIPMSYMSRALPPQNLLMLILFGALFSLFYILICLKFFISNTASNFLITSLPNKLIPYVKPLTKLSS